MASKLCKNCNACKILYIRPHYFYIKHKARYCAVNNSRTDLHNTCDSWTAKKKEKPELSKSRFEKAEEDIKYLISLVNRLE